MSKLLVLRGLVKRKGLVMPRQQIEEQIVQEMVDNVCTVRAAHTSRVPVVQEQTATGYAGLALGSPRQRFSCAEGRQHEPEKAKKHRERFSDQDYPETQ